MKQIIDVFYMISTACPIHSVNTKGLVDFKPEATETQRTQAETIMREWLYYRVSLSASKPSIQANGVDTSTVTIQLQSTESGTPANVSRSMALTLLVDGEPQVVTIDATGKATLQLSAVLAGTYRLEADYYESDVLEIQAL